jgi:hypothetical protein
VVKALRRQLLLNGCGLLIGPRYLLWLLLIRYFTGCTLYLIMDQTLPRSVRLGLLRLTGVMVPRR